MKLNIYSIYDTAIGSYMRPFFMQADGQAMRLFKDMANDKEHEIGRHPEDYCLFRIGVWDDQTADFRVEPPDALMQGMQAVHGNEERGNGTNDSRKATDARVSERPAGGHTEVDVQPESSASNNV